MVLSWRPQGAGADKRSGSNGLPGKSPANLHHSKRLVPMTFLTTAWEWLHSHALSTPSLAKFALGMAIIVGIPPLSRRARLPAVVGLLLCGVVIGPHVLGLFGEHAPVADFFAELGKLLLMFFAGLEIDIAQFRRERNKSVIFGLVTTLTPLLLGTAVGLLFGYQPVAAVVLGSLLASHTLLAAPIIVRLGATRLEPITITFGATVFSDTLSLIVFAICVPIYQSGFSVSGLVVQVIEIAIFVPLILFGLSRLGAYTLRKFEDDEDAYFILMLAIMAVAGLQSTLHLGSSKTQSHRIECRPPEHPDSAGVHRDYEPAPR